MSPLGISPGLSISSRRVFVLRSDRDDTKEVPNLLACLSLRAVVRTPAVDELTDCFFSIRSGPSPSLQRLGICHYPPVSMVVCVFGAATFALCYGRWVCLLFTGQELLLRAFASRVAPESVEYNYPAKTVNCRSRTFTGKTTQHYGLPSRDARGMK